MRYDDMIAAGLRELDGPIKFHSAFPDSEHTIVFSKRDMEEGWCEVREWISRTSLYDRYVIWLCVAIEPSQDGTLTVLESPSVYCVTLDKVHKSRADVEGPKWECEIGEIEYGDWEQLLVNGEDIAAAADLLTDNPVDRFDTFWIDTRPTPEASVPDGMAFLAPIRFLLAATD